MKLSPKQLIVYSRLTDKPQNCYTLKCSIATARSLVKQGAAKDVTPRGPGAMFSPLTHFQFIKLQKDFKS